MKHTPVKDKPPQVFLDLSREELESKVLNLEIQVDELRWRLANTMQTLTLLGEFVFNRKHLEKCETPPVDVK